VRKGKREKRKEWKGKKKKSVKNGRGGEERKE